MDASELRCGSGVIGFCDHGWLGGTCDIGVSSAKRARSFRFLFLTLVHRHTCHLGPSSSTCHL